MIIHKMSGNKTFTQRRRHTLYKALFFIFVVFVLVAIVELQPSTDVPAPIFYGIILVLTVDAIYYELIVRWATGKRGSCMVRRYFNS